MCLCVCVVGGGMNTERGFSFLRHLECDGRFLLLPSCEDQIVWTGENALVSTLHAGRRAGLRV